MFIASFFHHPSPSRFIFLHTTHFAIAPLATSAYDAQPSHPTRSLSLCIPLLVTRKRDESSTCLPLYVCEMSAGVAPDGRHRTAHSCSLTPFLQLVSRGIVALLIMLH